jgi:uncharacterized protein (DUF3820 family)
MSLDTLNHLPENVRRVLLCPQGMVERVPNTPLLTKTMRTEFIHIIQLVTKEIFNPEQWNGQSLQEDLNEEGITECCICTKEIHNLYEICHIPTQIRFKVGCDCVEKISKKLRDKIVKDKCIMCKGVVQDRRRRYQKDGYCGEECYADHNPTIDFGKHENERIEDLPQSYIDWLNKKYRHVDKFKTFFRIMDHKLRSNPKLAVIPLKPVMPFGKHKGILLDNLPNNYIVWLNTNVRCDPSKTDLFEQLDKMPLKPVMPFGKHKGILLDNLPDNYLVWLNTNVRCDPSKTDLFEQLDKIYEF